MHVDDVHDGAQLVQGLEGALALPARFKRPHEKRRAADEDGEADGGIEGLQEIRKLIDAAQRRRVFQHQGQSEERY